MGRLPGSEDQVATDHENVFGDVIEEEPCFERSGWGSAFIYTLSLLPESLVAVALREAPPRPWGASGRELIQPAGELLQGDPCPRRAPFAGAFWGLPPPKQILPETEMEKEPPRGHLSAQ